MKTICLILYYGFLSVCLINKAAEHTVVNSSRKDQHPYICRGKPEWAPLYRRSQGSPYFVACTYVCSTVSQIFKTTLQLEFCKVCHIWLYKCLAVSQNLANNLNYFILMIFDRICAHSTVSRQPESHKLLFSWNKWMVELNPWLNCFVDIAENCISCECEIRSQQVLLQHLLKSRLK